MPLKKLKKTSSKRFGIFASDGDTIIKEDSHGSDLVGIPISRVIKALEEDCQDSEYRRNQIALAAFKVIEQTFDPDRIFAVWYGH